MAAMAVYAEIPNSTRIETAKEKQTAPWNTEIGAHSEKTRNRNSASSTGGNPSSRPPQRRACGSVGSSIAAEEAAAVTSRARQGRKCRAILATGKVQRGMHVSQVRIDSLCNFWWLLWTGTGTDCKGETPDAAAAPRRPMCSIAQSNHSWAAGAGLLGGSPASRARMASSREAAFAPSTSVSSRSYCACISSSRAW